MSAFKILGRLVSKADQALDTIKREKGTGAEFLRELEKTPGVKQAELKERGIDKALKSKPKMTKAEVKKVLEENPPPKLKEQVRGGDEYQEALDSKAKEIVGDRYATFDDLYGRDREAAREAVESELGFSPETQYEKYKTPGGENYREILLKLPKRGLSEGEQDILMTYESNIRRGDVLDPFHQKQYENLLAKKEAGSQDYFTPHFEGEPNVLAHIRVQDFKTPEGKKVLLVDEIQSDWHQAAHQERQKETKRLMKERGIDKKQASALVPENYGYRPQDVKAQLKESEERMERRGQQIRQLSNRMAALDDTQLDEFNALAVERQRLQDLQGEEIDWGNRIYDSLSSGVPDAPFKKNWHELAMKRVLDYAADKGYDTVAITPGAEQAKRYDLSKHINDLEWDSQTGSLKAWDHAGNPVISKGGVSEQDLPNYIGKEATQRLLEKEHTTKQLFGADLQVGGEGMKGFYDQILPTYLNNLGKQYGASVGQFDLVTQPSKIEQAGRSFYQTPQKTVTVHSFDITPQMREEIKAKGLPLYGKIALPEAGTLAAGSGAATIGIGAPEQPLPPQMYAQPEYRRGGQVKRKVKFTNNPDTMRLELMSKDR